jgi:transcriptional regulator with XRE-family HTH domain
MEKFSGWLSLQLSEKNLSQAELARRSGITQSNISLVLNEKRNPGPDFCKKIARGLKMPPEKVYRAAGLLSPKKITEEIIEQAEHIINSYKYPETKQRALAYLEFLRQEEEKGESRVSPARHPISEPG